VTKRIAQADADGTTSQNDGADRGLARIALLMIFEAATLAAIASLHLGGVLEGSRPFRPTAAGIAEAIIGLALVIGAATMLRRLPHARRIAIATTLFAIVGFAVGLSFTLRGGGTVDVVYHALMLPLLLLTLVLLLRDDLRQSPPSPDGHQSGPGRSDRRGAGERSQTGTCVCENRHEATGRSMPETAARARLRRRPPAVERESTRRSARLARFVERYLLNPQMRVGLALGLAPRAFALLETIGRRSGKPRRTPVGNGLLGDTFWLVSEHGRGAGYVRNLEANPRVRVKIGRRWRAGSARVLPRDDPYARLELVASALGTMRRLDAAILRSFVRWLGTEPVTVRIDLDRRSGGELIPARSQQ
jgi:deazaflavin-dependent oxidoreductase (nitroreductase family)